jgi:hypothetical protein
VPESRKGQFWFRSLEVAFEHENSFNRDVYQEIAHLLILRARLSVLVTYPNTFDEKLMGYFHSFIEPCPHASELDANESFLMILGWSDPLRWDGYAFKKDGWKRLETARREDARA